MSDATLQLWSSHPSRVVHEAYRDGAFLGLVDVSVTDANELVINVTPDTDELAVVVKVAK